VTPRCVTCAREEPIGNGIFGWVIIEGTGIH
jgi:hypothetical protein